jgi:septal ring factor EnvC (AmiA/AmiB activator)
LKAFSIPLLARKMDYCNERLTVAEGEIKAVEDQIADVERRLLEPDAVIQYLREEKNQLREKEHQLREKERLILEIILRQSPGR